jgi:DNA-binding NarL/FixJ family response regulator
MRRTETSRKVGTPAAAVDGNAVAKPTESSFPAARPARKRKTAPVCIALIDPKPLTRQSIVEMLAKALPDYTKVAASGCEELIETREKVSGRPRLVIIHIRGAGVLDSWVQNTFELVKLRLPDIPVTVFSDRDDVDDILKALACGVRGYIPTSVEVDVASAALRLVNAGGTFIPAHALRSAPVAPNGSEGERRGLPDKLDLTPRELSVIDLLREGKPNKLIAIELKMQESTVKVHVRNIMKKLHVANRTHAASVANRLLGQHVPATAASPLPPAPAGANGLAAAANAEGK